MKFKILYADPPWAYKNSNCSKKFGGTAQSKYKTYGPSEMGKWPVEKIAADNSLLFLWATLPNLPSALKVMEMWGFQYVTTPFVWVKTYKKSNKLFCGFGFWTRSGAEVVLMGRKGKGVPRQAKNVRQVFMGPVTQHSSKPPEIRDQIIRLVGNASKIELFSRNPEVKGWAHTGLESDGRDIVKAMDYYSAL